MFWQVKLSLFKTSCFIKYLLKIAFLMSSVSSVFCETSKFWKYSLNDWSFAYFLYFPFVIFLVRLRGLEPRMTSRSPVLQTGAVPILLQSQKGHRRRIELRFLGPQPSVLPLNYLQHGWARGNRTLLSCSKDRYLSTKRQPFNRWAWGDLNSCFPIKSRMFCQAKLQALNRHGGIWTHAISGIFVNTY